PTWTEKNGQDDITWQQGTYEPLGDGAYKVTYQVKKSDHNNETGIYNTLIYAYDAKGKMTYVALEPVTVPEEKQFEINNVEISNITAQGYTVSCLVKAEAGLDRVEFPTWTEKNGQDDITWER
ncbi:GBS Bsp-like repeat-containing protein, partial [[Clostridium] spiroforme]|nr:GBS Bsp-like repeat-containing protein [Thomasclavelia spiroformis]